MADDAAAISDGEERGNLLRIRDGDPEIQEEIRLVHEVRHWLAGLAGGALPRDSLFNAINYSTLRFDLPSPPPEPAMLDLDDMGPAWVRRQRLTERGP